MVLPEEVGWEAEWYMAREYIFVTRLSTWFVSNLYILMKHTNFKKENWNHLGYLNNEKNKHVKYIPFFQVKDFLLRFITVVYNISFMCTTLYFYFCIHYSVLTTKNFVSIHHHKVDPLYPLHPPLIPSPLVATALFSVSTCLFLFGLVCSFIYLFFKFHIWVKSYSICLSPSDLFHLA